MQSGVPSENPLPASGARALPRRTRVVAGLLSFCLLASAAGLRAAVAGAQEPPASPPSRDEQAQVLERQRARETEAYAKAHGVSMEEAARRLRWQQIATTDFVDNSRRDLGASFGGVWIDPATGRVKLGVASTSEAVRSGGRGALTSAGLEDGGDVVSVEYSEAELSAASDWLRERVAKVNDGAPRSLVFGTRTEENAVALQLPVDAELTAAQRALIDEAVERFDTAVRLDEYHGALQPLACFGHYCEPPLRAGVWIETNGAPYCTGGFISIGRDQQYLHQMTAGHCQVGGIVNTRNYPGGPRRDIGPFQNAYDGPSGDAGVVRISNPASWNPQPWVFVHESNETARNEAYKIRNRGTSVVGMDVCASGASTGFSDCGKVTEVNHCASWGVCNQTRSNVCAIPGDSGAPTWKHENAFGILVSRYSHCDTLYTERAAAENLTNTDIATWRW